MHKTLRVLLLMCLLGLQISHAKPLHFVTEDFPPFSYPHPQPSYTHQAAGPMPEVVEHLCKLLDRACLIELLPWKRAQALAERHEVDGIFSVVRSGAREANFYFSPMLVRSSYSVFSNRSYAFSYFQPHDLSGHTVGVYGPSGTSYVLDQNIRQVDDVSLFMTTDNRRLLRMLDSGRFGPRGVIVANRDVALSLIQEEKLVNVQEAGQLQTIEYGIALSRSRTSADFFAQFNHAVEQGIADGSLAEILRRHALQPAVYLAP